MDNFIQLYIYFPSSFFECIREKPILIENECELKYCQKEEFSSGICTINNNIIKTQWLNNIVVFNWDKLRYGSFALNSKGDLIYECSVEEKKGIRKFYWLKKMDIFALKMKMENIYLQKNNCEKWKWLSYKIWIKKIALFFAKNANSENIISISLYLRMFEYYDLENNSVSLITTYDFTNYNIYSKISELIELKNNEYLNIFIGVKINDLLHSKFYLILQKYNF